MRKHPLPPASELRRQKYYDNEISDYVHDILYTINDEIETAIGGGENKATVEIPVTFSVNRMSCRDAQRHIYFKLLNELIDLEYRPKLQFIKNKSSVSVLLHIKWANQKDSEFNTYMDNFISSHLLNKKTKQTPTEVPSIAYPDKHKNRDEYR